MSPLSHILTCPIDQSQGGFPVNAETTCNTLASTRKLAEQFPVIVWIRQFTEHRPDPSITQRQAYKAIAFIS